MVVKMDGRNYPLSLGKRTKPYSIIRLGNLAELPMASGPGGEPPIHMAQKFLASIVASRPRLLQAPIRQLSAQTQRNIPTPYPIPPEWRPFQNIADLPSVTSILFAPRRTVHGQVRGQYEHLSVQEI